LRFFNLLYKKPSSSNPNKKTAENELQPIEKISKTIFLLPNEKSDEIIPVVNTAIRLTFSKGNAIMNHDCYLKRRVHERYRVDWCKIGVTKDRYTKIGYIHDISIGGLSFHYVDNGEGKGEFPNSSVLSIFLDSKGFFLEKIPFKTINDFKIEPDFVEMRQRSVQFGSIHREQKLHLKYLIENLTIGKVTDKRSGKDRRSHLKSRYHPMWQPGDVLMNEGKIMERRTGMERRIYGALKQQISHFQD